MGLKESLSQIAYKTAVIVMGGEQNLREGLCNLQVERLVDRFYSGDLRLRDARNIADQMTANAKSYPFNFKERFDASVTQRSIDSAPDNKLPWSL